jgi:hypothetical protein
VYGGSADFQYAHFTIFNPVSQPNAPPDEQAERILNDGFGTGMREKAAQVKTANDAKGRAAQARGFDGIPSARR